MIAIAFQRCFRVYH